MIKIGIYKAYCGHEKCRLGKVVNFRYKYGEPTWVESKGPNGERVYYHTSCYGELNKRDKLNWSAEVGLDKGLPTVKFKVGNLL